MDIASETSERSLRQKSPPRIEVPVSEQSTMQQENSCKPSPNRNDWISRFIVLVSCRSAQNVSDPSLNQSAVEVPYYHHEHHEQKSSSSGSVVLPRQESAQTFRSDSGTYPAVQQNTLQEQEATQAQAITTELSTQEVVTFDENHIPDEFLMLHDDNHSQVEPVELEPVAITPSMVPALHRQGSGSKAVPVGPIRMSSVSASSRVEIASRETVGHSSSFIIPDAKSYSHSPQTSLERIPSVGYGQSSGSAFVSRTGSYDAMTYPAASPYMMPQPQPQHPAAVIMPPQLLQPVVMNGVLYYPQAIDANHHPHLLSQQQQQSMSLSFYGGNYPQPQQMMVPPPQMMMPARQASPMLYANNGSPPVSFYSNGQQQDMMYASPSPPLLSRQMSNGENTQHRSSSAQRTSRRRNSFDKNNNNNMLLPSRSASAGRSSSSTRDSPVSLHHGRGTREELDYAMRASILEEEQRQMRMSADDQALHAAIMQSLHDQNNANVHAVAAVHSPEPSSSLSSKASGSGGRRGSAKRVSSDPRLPPAGPRRLSSSQMGGHV